MKNPGSSWVDCSYEWTFFRPKMSKGGQKVLLPKLLRTPELPALNLLWYFSVAFCCWIFASPILPHTQLQRFHAWGGENLLLGESPRNTCSGHPPDLFGRSHNPPTRTHTHTRMHRSTQFRWPEGSCSASLSLKLVSFPSLARLPVFVETFRAFILCGELRSKVSSSVKKTLLAWPYHKFADMISIKVYALHVFSNSCANGKGPN